MKTHISAVRAGLPLRQGRICGSGIWTTIAIRPCFILLLQHIQLNTSSLGEILISSLCPCQNKYLSPLPSWLPFDRCPLRLHEHPVLLRPRLAPGQRHTVCRRPIQLSKTYRCPGKMKTSRLYIDRRSLQSQPPPYLSQSKIQIPYTPQCRSRARAAETVC